MFFSQRVIVRPAGVGSRVSMVRGRSAPLPHLPIRPGTNYGRVGIVRFVDGQVKRTFVVSHREYVVRARPFGERVARREVRSQLRVSATIYQLCQLRVFLVRKEGRRVARVQTICFRRSHASPLIMWRATSSGHVGTSYRVVVLSTGQRKVWPSSFRIRVPTFHIRHRTLRHGPIISYHRRPLGADHFGQRAAQVPRPTLDLQCKVCPRVIYLRVRIHRFVRLSLVFGHGEVLRLYLPSASHAGEGHVWSEQSRFVGERKASREVHLHLVRTFLLHFFDEQRTFPHRVGNLCVQEGSVWQTHHRMVRHVFAARLCSFRFGNSSRHVRVTIQPLFLFPPRFALKYGHGVESEGGEVFHARRSPVHLRAGIVVNR